MTPDEAKELDQLIDLDLADLLSDQQRERLAELQAAYNAEMTGIFWLHNPAN